MLLEQNGFTDETVEGASSLLQIIHMKQILKKALNWNTPKLF